MTPADKLRDRLASLDLTQRGAARALHIDERTMRRYCSGTHPIPQVIWLALDGLGKQRIRK